jgi:hypothetical protein
MMIYGHERNDMGKEDAAVILVLSECRLTNLDGSPKLPGLSSLKLN